MDTRGIEKEVHPAPFPVLALAIVLLLLTFCASPAEGSLPCPGDCRDDGQVSVDELITGVNIALGSQALDDCRPLDWSGDGALTVDELVRAVSQSFETCLDATVALPGLPGATDVVYDSLGIPHIYGSDFNSVAFVQGYVHAGQRFFQMDTLRRSGEGRLSELFGNSTLTSDVTMRTILTTRDGGRAEEVGWEQADPEVAATIEAYAQGVNAWLTDVSAARNGAALPPEYELLGLGPQDLAPWRPQDTMAIAAVAQWRNDGFNLSDTMTYAIAWSEWPEAVRRDAMRAAPLALVPLLSNSQEGLHGTSAYAAPPTDVALALPPPATAEAVRELLDTIERASPFGRRVSDAGSNNWAVAPALSDSGVAMLAADPHLALSNPAVWFLQQLDVAGDSPQWVSGATPPGIPGVNSGYNDTGAWGGGTNSYFDVVDVYVETITTPSDYPAHARTVLFKGEQVPVLRLEEQFAIRGQNPRTYVIEIVPHHGPMLPDPNLNDAAVGLAATGMTLRWVGNETGGGTRAHLDLMRAKNAAEFRAAVRNGAGRGKQNFVWADVHGDIAYTAFAPVPQRPAGTLPHLPMPGTGEAEWLTDEQGNVAWLPEDRFPEALNPAQSFIATANSDPIGHTFDNDPFNDEVFLAFTYDDGFREQRIQDLLSNRAAIRPSGAKITTADMSAYQYDTASLEACRMLPFLFAAAEARPDLVSATMADAIARLRSWTEEKPGSPACDAVSGIDAHDLRADVPPRARPVTDEERTDAVGSTLYHAWVWQIWEVLNVVWQHQLLPPSLFNWAKWSTILHLLEDIDQTDPAFQVYTKGPSGDSTLWDDPATPEVETRNEVLLEALGPAVDLLEDELGSSDMSTWQWGKVHQVRFEHAFGQGQIPGYDLGPFPAAGGRFTVNPGFPDVGLGIFTFSNGASRRVVVLLDPNGVRAFEILPGGENGDPGGEGAQNYNTINPATHYGDLVPGWINGEAVEMRLSRQQVLADSQRHIRYVPASTISP